MKILESKYYRPRHILSERHRDNQSFIEIKALDDKLRATDTPYSELIQSLMPCLNFYGDSIVIKRSHLADFIQCQDYHVVGFNKHNNIFYQAELCFFHPSYEFFLVCNENLSTDYEKTLFETGYLSVECLGYDSTRADNLNQIKAFYQTYLQTYQSPTGQVTLLLKENQDLVFKSHQIKPYALDLKTMYNDDFLEVHRNIIDSLTHKHKGVVLLHGIAGSGKTNYIKWLTAQIPNKNFIFVPNNMIESLARPEFMSMLIEKKNSILVLEDCENYIAERIGGGNSYDVVSNILNIADGILSDILECQFICTFNADLMDIDHALLRHGRLIAEYQFQALTVEKANQYLQSINQSLRVSEPKSLAELTNIDEKLYQAEKIKKPFGFAE